MSSAAREQELPPPRPVRPSVTNGRMGRLTSDAARSLRARPEERSAEVPAGHFRADDVAVGVLRHGPGADVVLPNPLPLVARAPFRVGIAHADRERVAPDVGDPAA